MAALRARVAVVALLALGTLFLAPAPAQAVLPDSTLTKWVFLTQQVVRNLKLTNQVSSHVYALSSYAYYRAYKLASESRDHDRPIPSLAAAFASHGVLSRLAPQLQPTLLDNPLQDDIWRSPYHPPASDAVRDASERIGVWVSNELVGPTVTDDAFKVSYYQLPAAGTVPDGVYQATPGQTFVLYPQYANASTLVYPTRDIPHLAAPYFAGINPLNSSQYAAELEYTYELGSINSTSRTPYQTDTAKFWLGAAQFATSLGSPALGGILQNITLQLLPANTTEYQAARTFAALGTSLWDVTVTLWYFRFKALRWRPITAIRAHLDPNWTPLLGTPQHPEYPSAHAGVFNAGIAVILRTLNITVDTPVPAFTLSAEGWDGIAPRTFTNLRATVEEAYLSRIYAGAHWNQSCTDAASFGRIIGTYVFDNLDKLKLGRQRPAWDYSP